MIAERWLPDRIIALTRGGLVPGTLLSHFLQVRLETYSVRLRDSQNIPCEDNDWLPRLAVGADGDRQNLLIVDDINDTGATIDWISDDWQRRYPDTNWSDIWNHNVRFAVLVDNIGSDCKRTIFYGGLEIDKRQEDVWIDFPWEVWWT